jgi:hypothetical protein
VVVETTEAIHQDKPDIENEQDNDREAVVEEQVYQNESIINICSTGKNS